MGLTVDSRRLSIYSFHLHCGLSFFKGPWNGLSSGSEGAANNNIYVRDWAL